MKPGTGGILILDRNDKLIGIVSTRDILFENDEFEACDRDHVHRCLHRTARNTL